MTGGNDVKELPNWKAALYLAFALLLPVIGSIDKIAW